jgi:hypothetical protein
VGPDARDSTLVGVVVREEEVDAPLRPVQVARTVAQPTGPVGPCGQVVEQGVEAVEEARRVTDGGGRGRDWVFRREEPGVGSAVGTQNSTPDTVES